MTHWRDEFTGITWSGASFGDGTMTDNDASPEEILLYRVYVELINDPVLISLFTPSGASTPERIEAMEVRNALAFEGLPRLQVYLASTTEEQRPTRLEVTDIRVFIGLRFDLVHAMSRLVPGTPTFFTVIRQVKNALNANHQLVTDIGPGPTETPLAAGSSKQEGAISWIIDENEAGDRITLTAELEWIYNVVVEFGEADAGKIANIVRAGG